MTKTVAVVILNYNGEKFLERFLPSVLQNSNEHAEIFVADNASTDGSVNLIQKRFPAIHLIQLDHNEGYAGGYNNALKKIKADYYILLNSDVEVTENWIMPVIDRMENDSTIAACQPKIRSYDQREYFEYAGAAGGFIDWLGYPFCRGRIFEKLEKDTGQYNDEKEIFWASGACMFLRAKTFHQSGGFDSSFFAHMEEIDLCWRMKNSGLKVFYSPLSTVFHVGGGTLQKNNPRKTFLNFRNNLRMLWKNLPWHSFIFVIIIRCMLDFAVVAKNAFSLNFGNAYAVIKAHLLLYPYILKPKSKDSEVKISFSKMKGVYHHSLVVSYFIKNVRTFSKLKVD